VLNWFKYRPVEPYTAICYTKETGFSPTYIMSFSILSIGAQCITLLFRVDFLCVAVVVTSSYQLLPDIHFCGRCFSCSNTIKHSSIDLVTLLGEILSFSSRNVFEYLTLSLNHFNYKARQWFKNNHLMIWI